MIDLCPSITLTSARRGLRSFLRLVAGRGHPIVIAGLPRCGTTFLYNTVASAEWALVKAPDFLKEFKAGLKQGVIYKTHDFPRNLGEESEAKIVFVFCDPYAAVFSAARNFRTPAAFLHMHSQDFHKRSDLYDRDILRLEEHFDSWYQPQDISLSP